MIDTGVPSEDFMDKVFEDVLEEDGTLYASHIMVNHLEDLSYSQRLRSLVSIFNYKKRLKSLRGRMFYKTIHEDTDKAIEDALKTYTKTEKVSCRRGCSHCCYMFVDVFPHEAVALANKVKKGQYYNKEEFELQKDKTTPQEYVDDPRPCIFLKEGECSVYADRPMTCRKYFVVNDSPDLCEIIPGESNQVQNPLMYEAEVIYSAVAQVAESHDPMGMAHMVDRALKGEFKDGK